MYNSGAALLVVGITGLLTVFTVLWLIINVLTQTKKEAKTKKNANNPQLTRAQRRTELKSKLRRRRAAERRSLVNGGNLDSVEEQDVEVGSEDSDLVDIANFQGSKKKLRKLKKKQEKKDRREWEAHQREEKLISEEEKRAASNYEHKVAEEERLRREKMEIEENRKAEEEAQKEFDSWKGLFEVSEAGDEIDTVDFNSDCLLQKFISYIKLRKIVILEDVAAEFGLHSKDVIHRINSLQSMGTITGVFDDRGKFIYITEEEMLRIANFIKTEGRVSLTTLAERSNELINLLPLKILPEKDIEAKLIDEVVYQECKNTISTGGDVVIIEKVQQGR